ncbi:MAG: carbamoyltransferase HypF [Armatimonadetes bacterium]|nr:carbamoyltransferase HypF [Armatimonadota bacterium]
MEVYRRKFRITGVVQGVGFRPFVYRLALKYDLSGWVRNTSGSVEVEVEGDISSIKAFASGLQTEAPNLAQIDSLSAIEADPVGYAEFLILESKAEETAEGVIPADVATCPDCLMEIASPKDRRFEYPFTNCTNCGPRFTIIQRVPYDRPNTTMATFPMCEDCAREYQDPLNRRFHAEPTACPVCGPRVWLEIDSQRIDTDPISATAELLRKGKIVAIKGLGGFHLACDARNDEAVSELRVRKGRVAKPFALMVRDIDEAELLCELDDASKALLLSNQRPIALARKREPSRVSDLVAPGNRQLGLVIPYTPLHTLLMQQCPPAIVLTSGNLSEEPLAFTNGSARTKLSKLADAFLMNDRDIHVPCDDSVVRSLPGGDAIIARRARGCVPEAIDLPINCDCILGTGAEQKNTFCLAWGRKAVPSQHIGDLDTAETFDYYQYAIDHLQSLLGHQPKVIAHDLHPSYMSSRYAMSRPNVELIGVQHHHAHIAACLAENGRNERCIGLAMDGTGYGTDGTIWGGEILLADLASFERVGHFAQVRMPGGEAAIRDPKRMAAAYLHEAFAADNEHISECLGLSFQALEQRVIRHQLETGLNSPLTSSAGRFFDAISAAIGICAERSFEGQPAIELEMAADEHEQGSYPYSIDFNAGRLVLNAIPTFKAAVEERLAGIAPATIAAKCHNSVIEMLACACEKLREREGINLIALSGGVFQNAIIHSGLKDKLQTMGFEVLIHKKMPPNDACISLGQVAIAAAILKIKQE